MIIPRKRGERGMDGSERHASRNGSKRDPKSRILYTELLKYIVLQ